MTMNGLICLKKYELQLHVLSKAGRVVCVFYTLAMYQVKNSILAECCPCSLINIRTSSAVLHFVTADPIIFNLHNNFIIMLTFINNVCLTQAPGLLLSYHSKHQFIRPSSAAYHNNQPEPRIQNKSSSLQQLGTISNGTSLVIRILLTQKQLKLKLQCVLVLLCPAFPFNCSMTLDPRSVSVGGKVISTRAPLVSKV